MEDFDTRQIVIDEQKEEIEYLYKYIEQLETKNKILNKALTYSCKDIETLSGNCPLCDYDCNNYEYNHIECWKNYFLVKAKEGK